MVFGNLFRRSEQRVDPSPYFSGAKVQELPGEKSRIHEKEFLEPRVDRLPPHGAEVVSLPERQEVSSVVDTQLIGLRQALLQSNTEYHFVLAQGRGVDNKPYNTNPLYWKLLAKGIEHFALGDLSQAVILAKAIANNLEQGKERDRNVAEDINEFVTEINEVVHLESPPISQLHR